MGFETGKLGFNLLTFSPCIYFGSCGFSMRKVARHIQPEIIRRPGKMPPKKNAQSTAAEISLVRLENCLVNLPSSLVSLLVNVNTVSLRFDLARYLLQAS